MPGSHEVPLGLGLEDIAAVDYAGQRAGGNAPMLIGAYERDYTIENVLSRGSYEIGQRHMYISDVVWGEAHIGDEPYDQLLVELARTPLFRRLQSIEQLTLPKDYATMPNTMYFSRWEHIWGSLVFVRKMVEGRGDIDDRQKMVLQLRTLLSDVGHTAFSHLGDWMFQGVKGGEDMHDRDLKDILRVSGLESILERYGFSVEETVFPDVHDWVECSSPDLCVDRVDYGFREMLRWVQPTVPFHLYLRELQDPQSIFDITAEGRLVFRSPTMARFFAAGFSLLATEHWSHPVHRMQLQLFESGIRASVIDKSQTTDLHPREALYGIDNDYMMHLQTWPMRNLQVLLKSTGLEQRKIFVEGRRADLDSLFVGIMTEKWKFPAYPDPRKPYTWQTKQMGRPYPSNVTLQRVTESSEEKLDSNRRGLAVNLPSLKARAVDPPVQISSKQADGSTITEIKRLSEIDPSYAKYLQRQKEMMTHAYKATVLMRPDVARLIVAEHRDADATWQNLQRRSRSAARLAKVIKDADTFGAGHRFDRVFESNDTTIQRRVGRQSLKHS